MALNVLSLFDGISCGRLALFRAEIDVNRYFRSEINKYTNQIAMHHYPNDIQLGDVTKWREWVIDWSSIDLLIGGSPCQGFSLAGKKLGFDDPRSKLFFEYVDILNQIKKHNPNIKFMLENVKMKKEFIQIINNQLGVEPIIINSALLSAQNRVRLYWCNWEVAQPEDKGILLKNILEDINDGFITLSESNYTDKCKKQIKKNSKTIDEKAISLYTNSNMTGSGVNVVKTFSVCKVGNVNPSGRGMNGNVYSIYGEKSPTLTTNKGEGIKITGCAIGCRYRKLTPIECERLQTIPDNYTAMVSNSQRYKALGNSWTVDVIAHIFSKINKHLNI